MLKRSYSRERRNEIGEGVARLDGMGEACRMGVSYLGFHI